MDVLDQMAAEILSNTLRSRRLAAGERKVVRDLYALPDGAREGNGAQWISGEVEVLIARDPSTGDMRIRQVEGGAEFWLVDPLMIEASP